MRAIERDGIFRDRIRVLWVIKSLFHGGAEQLLVSAARVADHRRFDYQAAYVVRTEANLVASLESHEVTTHSIGRGSRGGILWPLRLRRLLIEIKPDIAHAHSPLPAAILRLTSLTIGKSTRPHIVTTEHNVWQQFRRPTRWLNAVTCFLDERRWAVSAKVRSSMWARHAANTVTLIHGIVAEDIHATAPDARAKVRDEFGISDQDLLVTTVANLREQKDYPNLLRAAKSVIEAEPRARFLAVGQGHLETGLRQIHARLGLGERFLFAGYRADVMDVLAASDLFVLASKYEGYPIAVMEAMAMGLPVVSTTVGGVPDAVRDGVEGHLVPPQDSARLAGAILNVLKDDHVRASMAAAAIAKGASFDIRYAVDVIETAYTELVNDPLHAA